MGEGSQNTARAWMWSSVHGLSPRRLAEKALAGAGLRMKARVPEVLGSSGGYSGDGLGGRDEGLKSKRQLTGQ